MDKSWFNCEDVLLGEFLPRTKTMRPVSSLVLSHTPTGHRQTAAVGASLCGTEFPHTQYYILTVCYKGPDLFDLLFNLSLHLVNLYCLVSCLPSIRL